MIDLLEVEARQIQCKHKVQFCNRKGCQLIISY